MIIFCNQEKAFKQGISIVFVKKSFDKGTKMNNFFIQGDFVQK